MSARTSLALLGGLHALLSPDTVTQALALGAAFVAAHQRQAAALEKIADTLEMEQDAH